MCKKADQIIFQHGDQMEYDINVDSIITIIRIYKLHLDDRLINPNKVNLTNPNYMYDIGSDKVFSYIYSFDDQLNMLPTYINEMISM